MKHKTISIIGAGSVGTSTAYALILKNVVPEVLMADLNNQKCQGEIRDLIDVLPFAETSKIRQATVQDAGKADIIIITAGKHTSPGMKRTELLEGNHEILVSILKELAPINPEAIVIIATSPLDILTRVAQEQLGLPKQQVIGTGTFLDSRRLNRILSLRLSISQQSIEGLVIGEHGEGQFVAWTHSNISGYPITSFGISKEDFEKIEIQTRNEAPEIVKLKGSTFFGIGTSLAHLCEIIVYDQKRIVPISCYVEDLGVCLSVPVVLGEKGVERYIDLRLNDEEKTKLEHSAMNLAELYSSLFR
jgi:L-lactate dehydrogenase